MSQNTSGYQDLIINNGVISTVSNLSDAAALQGLQMANQFAICANPGSTPVLVPCITPMILSPQTAIKTSLDANNQDGRSQNNNSTNAQSVNSQSQLIPQIQFANNLAIPANMTAINSANNLPLGLSYINLSSLTSQSGAIPIQIALNSGSNQHITLPLASITQLTNDLQISNAYTLAPQVKFEPDTNDQMAHLAASGLQKDNIKTVSQDNSEEMQTSRRGRKRKIPYMKKVKNEEVSHDSKSAAAAVAAAAASQSNGDAELLYDNKGRPFIYECSQCPKKFTQNSRLTAHLRCHSGIRPYTCTQCGFSFTQKSYLIRHAAVHKEDRPFTCAKCLKTYKHYGSLANHRKLHCKESNSGCGGEFNTTNGSGNKDSQNTVDDLDETIQRAIDSAQIAAGPGNSMIIAYTNNPGSTGELQATPVIYLSQSAAATGATVQQTQSTADLQLPAGSGPVVFPSQDLPIISAVSLLPTNQSAIKELKAITTVSSNSTNIADDGSGTGDFQHIKQEVSFISGQSLQVSSDTSTDN